MKRKQKNGTAICRRNPVHQIRGNTMDVSDDTNFNDGSSSSSNNTAMVLFQKYSDMQQLIDTSRSKRQMIMSQMKDIQDRIQHSEDVRHQESNQTNINQTSLLNISESNKKQVATSEVANNDNDDSTQTDILNTAHAFCSTMYEKQEYLPIQHYQNILSSSQNEYDALMMEYHSKKQTFEQWNVWKSSIVDNILDESSKFRTKCKELQRSAFEYNIQQQIPYYFTQTVRPFQNQDHVDSKGESHTIETCQSDNQVIETMYDTSDNNFNEEDLVPERDTNFNDGDSDDEVDLNNFSNEAMLESSLSKLPKCDHDQELVDALMEYKNKRTDYELEYANLQDVQQKKTEQEKKVFQREQRLQTLELQLERISNDNVQLEKQIHLTNARKVPSKHSITRMAQGDDGNIKVRERAASHGLRNPYARNSHDHVKSSIRDTSRPHRAIRNDTSMGQNSRENTHSCNAYQILEGVDYVRGQSILYDNEMSNEIIQDSYDGNGNNMSWNNKAIDRDAASGQDQSNARNEASNVNFASVDMTRSVDNSKQRLQRTFHQGNNAGRLFYRDKRFGCSIGIASSLSYAVENAENNTDLNTSDKENYNDTRPDLNGCFDTPTCATTLLSRQSASATKYHILKEPNDNRSVQGQVSENINHSKNKDVSPDSIFLADYDDEDEDEDHLLSVNVFSVKPSKSTY